jgi:hypothetical protein
MSYSFIIDPTVPFNGRNYSCMNSKTNKTFSGETIEEYRVSEGNSNLTVVDEDEFDKKYYRPYLESYRSDWKEVSKEEFNDLYECLPPFKIGTINVKTASIIWLPVVYLIKQKNL